MVALSRILAATKFCSGSDNAVNRAASICVALKGSALELISVKSRKLSSAAQDMGIKRIRAELSIARGMLRQRYGIRALPVVRYGFAAQEVASYAELNKTGLLVVGWNGATGLFGRMVGTTAERIMYSSRRQLLIVRQIPEKPYRNVLVQVDFSKASRDAVRAALKLSAHGRITLLYVYRIWQQGHGTAGSPESARDLAAAIAARKMKRFIAGFGEESGRLSYVVQFDFQSAGLLACIERQCPDLLVLSMPEKSGVAKLGAYLATRSILRQCDADVLVLRSPAHGAGRPRDIVL